MNLKLFFLGLMLCINLTNVDSSDDSDYIEMWSNVGSKATKLLDDDNVQAGIAFLGELGHAIPYVGPLVKAVSQLLGSSHEASKFKKMNNKLDQLDSRFDEVLNKIESVHIIAGYKAKIEQVNNLKHAYERFTANPTVDTRDDFKAECGSNKMMMFARWIEKELNTETLLPLRKVMLDDFDMRNFNFWSNQIAALLSNAIFLHSTCLGVSGHNEKAISETLYGRNGGKGDIEIFIDVLKNVKKGFNQGVKFIKRAFFSHARQEVKNFIGKHSDLGHQEFADKLYQMLSNKYYWRLWGVVSLKAYVFISNDEKELTNVNFWYWDGERTVAVGSVLPDKSNTIYKKLVRDIDRCHSRSKSRFDHLADLLHSCHIEGSFYRISTYWKMYKKYSAKFPCFYNPYYRRYRFEEHVVAVPNDNSATITDGEVCSPTGDFCSGDYHCCPKSEQINEYFCCADTLSCAENGCEKPVVLSFGLPTTLVNIYLILLLVCLQILTTNFHL